MSSQPVIDDFSESDACVGNTWFKFEVPGNEVSGIIQDIFDVEANGKFGPQKVFALLQSDGTTINVGIKKTTFNLTATLHWTIGGKAKIRFEKTIPTKIKGHHDAKSLSFFYKALGHY